MKIAIVGSGVSGLVSAYLLSTKYEVTLFEKDSRLGGHSHTLFIKENGKEIAVDNGFMVYNPERYPNFVKLLEKLGVKSRKTQMTFGVNIPGEVIYRGDFPIGLFAKKSNLFTLRFLKFIFEVAKFRKIAKDFLKEKGNEEITLGQFIKKHKFSSDLTNWFLFPMLSAIWSIERFEKVGDFPALSTFVFLNNHKLLNHWQPSWRTIVGGSIQYVEKIKKALGKNGAKIILNTNIKQITRKKDLVEIITQDGKMSFDYVVFATHADTTAQLINDINKEEKEALGMFSYSKNKTVLHKDSSFVPENKGLLAAWNYNQEGISKSKASFTYCMNILQHIPKSTPVFVTLNPNKEIDKNKIYAVEDYEHLIFNHKTLEGQFHLALLQGQRRTFYVGAHLGYGFHEDGVVSAFNIARKLEVPSL